MLEIFHTAEEKDLRQQKSGSTKIGDKKLDGANKQRERLMENCKKKITQSESVVITGTHNK